MRSYCKNCARKYKSTPTDPDYNKKYYEANKARIKQQTKSWSKSNSSKKAAINIKRHCAKSQRTPKWLTSLDFNHIQMFYEVSAFLTKETGIKFEVDHIIPLQGKNVCGLHVPWNLQVITETDNIKKGNKY